MTQNGIERLGLFNFPINPTSSLEAFKRFTGLIEKYLSMFNFNGGGLSIGPIELGTPDKPSIIAPIEMDPGGIESHLRPTADILKRAIDEAKESIKWTRKIMELTSSVPHEAEERIYVLEKFQSIFNDYKGIAWHPKCYDEIRNTFGHKFRPGEPGISVTITITILV